MPNITSFPIWLFGFFIFLDFFKYFEKLERVLYTYRLGGDECQWANKLVPSSGTYLFSMQGSTCRIRTLEGDVSSRYGIIKLKKIYERLCLARIETNLSYMAYKIEARIRFKGQYDKRTHANAITT